MHMTNTTGSCTAFVYQLQHHPATTTSRRLQRAAKGKVTFAGVKQLHIESACSRATASTAEFKLHVCPLQGEAVAFALGGNRKILRTGSLAGLLNQELAAAGHTTAEVSGYLKSLGCS
jgi:hypothetical protein